MDTVRQILLRVEQAEEPVDALGDCDHGVFSYHVQLLIDAGFVEGDVVAGPNMLPMDASVFRLTWSGHEFLDSARSDSVWRAAKEKVLRPGASWTVGLLSEVLRGIAKQQLSEAGVPGLQ